MLFALFKSLVISVKGFDTVARHNPIFVDSILAASKTNLCDSGFIYLVDFLRTSDNSVTGFQNKS